MHFICFHVKLTALQEQWIIPIKLYYNIWFTEAMACIEAEFNYYPYGREIILVNVVYML